MSEAGLQAKSGLMSVFKNKDLLEHNHARPFMCYLWLFHTTQVRVNHVTETYGPQSLQYLLSGPLYKKFADSGITKTNREKSQMVLVEVLQ